MSTKLNALFKMKFAIKVIWNPAQYNSFKKSAILLSVGGVTASGYSLGLALVFN